MKTHRVMAVTNSLALVLSCSASFLSAGMAHAQDAGARASAEQNLEVTMTLLPEGATRPDAVTRVIELPAALLEQRRNVEAPEAEVAAERRDRSRELVPGTDDTDRRDANRGGSIDPGIDSGPFEDPRLTGFDVMDARQAAEAPPSDTIRTSAEEARAGGRDIAAQARESGSDAAEEVRDAGRDAAGEVRDAAGEVRDAAGEVRDAAGEIRDAGRDLVEQAEESRENIRRGRLSDLPGASDRPDLPDEPSAPN